MFLFARLLIDTVSVILVILLTDNCKKYYQKLLLGVFGL